jgi:hypothetical protein
MGVIQAKGSKPGMKAAFYPRDGRFPWGGDRLSANAIINDAFADIEAGVEFWKTIATNRHSKRGRSSEFLNRGG